jgi:hypothetical protein
MNKLEKFYERLENYDGDSQISVSWVMKDTELQQLELINFNVGTGHFIIDNDGNDGHELWLSYVTPYDEHHYHEPVIFDNTMDIDEFIKYSKTVSQIPPRLTKLEITHEIDFDHSLNIGDVMARLTWFRNQHKDCHTLCDISDTYDTFYFNCRAYRIESNDVYDARLLAKRKKAEEEFKRSQEREESSRLTYREEILKKIESLDNERKELYNILDEL